MSCLGKNYTTQWTSIARARNEKNLPGKLEDNARRTRLLTELGARDRSDAPWALGLFEFDEITAWFSFPAPVVPETVN